MFQNINQHKFFQKDNKEILQTLIKDIFITHDIILEHFPPQHAKIITNCLSQEVINSLFDELELFKSILHHLNSIDDINSKIKYIESIFQQEEEEENIPFQSYINFNVTVDNSQDNTHQESNNPEIILEEKIPDEDLEIFIRIIVIRGKKYLQNCLVM